MRTLLRYDTRELLNVLSLAFDEHDAFQNDDEPSLQSRQVGLWQWEWTIP
jgi:hypothetical protein